METEKTNVYTSNMRHTPSDSGKITYKILLFYFSDTLVSLLSPEWYEDLSTTTTAKGLTTPNLLIGENEWDSQV